MHEIITLQFGKQSNYVGTHFWNTQESYFTYSGQEESVVDHDVNFRPGVAPDGSDTYTPRCVIYDFKNEFGTLKKINELYEAFNEQEANVWGGTTATQRQLPIQENEYQRHLNEGSDAPVLTKSNVRFWSDFNRVFYHPRSIVQIYESELNPNDRSFESRTSGEELFWTLDKEHDLFDRDMRPFVEECDQIQGISILTAVEDGWGGFSARYLDRLRDEFGKLPIWTWGLEETVTKRKARNVLRIANEARTLLEMTPNSSMYIPVAPKPLSLPPAMSIEGDSPWISSALQMVAIESTSLPSRLKVTGDRGFASMNNIADFLNVEGDKKIAGLRFRPLDHSVADGQGSTEYNLFPTTNELSANRQDRILAEIDIFRGSHLDQSKLNEQASSNNDGLRNDLQSFQTNLAFQFLDSFPTNYVFPTHREKFMSLNASLSVSPVVASWVKFLERSTKYHINTDEREEFSNGMQEISEAYEMAWSGSEGSDWED